MAKAIQEQNKAARRHLLTNCLPILGTALLLCWLSDGFPSASMKLLLQMGGQFGTLWAAHGASMLSPFLILLAQSLLFIGAWALLLWLAIREVRRFFALRSGVIQVPAARQMSLPARQEALPAPQEFHFVDAPVASPARGAEPAIGAAQNLFEAMPFSLDQGIAASSLEASLGNPFEEILSREEVARPPLRRTRQERIAPLNESRSMVEDTPSLTEDLQSSLPTTRREKPDRTKSARPAQPEEKKKKPTRPVPPEQEENRAVPDMQEEPVVEGHFSSILQDLGFVIQQPVDDEAIEAQEGAESTREETLQDENPFAEYDKLERPAGALYAPADPFNVKQEVLDIFAPASADKPDTSAHALMDDSLEEENQPNAMDDGEFLYGHPFDGPLPDVFRHDADLRRSVREQIAEEQEQAPSRRKSAAASENKTTKRTPRKKTP